MSKHQVQLKRTEWGVVKCICGCEARAYRTDASFHVECNPCRIFTVPLGTVVAAAEEFVRVCDVVRRDRMPKEIAQFKDRRNGKEKANP